MATKKPVTKEQFNKAAKVVSTYTKQEAVKAGKAAKEKGKVVGKAIAKKSHQLFDFVKSKMHKS